MDIRKIKEKIMPELYDELKILNGSEDEQQQRQDYLQGICQRLMADEFDFERYPVYFCIVDDKEPNAAFVPVARDKQEKGNKSDYPTIFVTKGLFELAQNEDQLAYILGHELGHLRQDFLDDEESRYLGHQNSKLEEMSSDLGSLDMMARAGYNINEARKIAAHIFGNESKYDTLSQILARSLDDHPNNESRLNAIDIKIKTIEDDYQKQNININDFTPTDISDGIKNDIKQNRHIATIEQELIKLGYYDEQKSLQERQDILLSYMQDILTKDDFKTSTWGGSRLKTYHEQTLDKIVYNHIANFREQMPRRIVKQSDAELFKGWIQYSKITELTPKWFEVVGTEYVDGIPPAMPDNQMTRVAILESYPFKIVPDEEYEKQVAIEEQKNKHLYTQIDNQTNLAVNFWDKILQMDLSEVHTNYFKYATASIAPIKGIDISKTTSGKAAISEIEKLSSVDERVAYDNLFNLNNTRYFHEDNLPKHLKMYYTTKGCHFYYRYKPESIPTLNLETNESAINKYISPQVLFDTNFPREQFGIGKQKILNDTYLVVYDKNYNNPEARNNSSDHWYYFVNDNGLILDSFPASMMIEKRRELIENKKQEIFKQLAQIVKQDYQLLQQIKQNPETELTDRDILRLKRYTGTKKYRSKTRMSNLEYYKETIKKDTDVLVYHTEPAAEILSLEYNRLERESGINDNLVNFSESRLASYLTDDELQFLSTTYNQKDDEAVFDKLYNSIENHIDDEYFWGLNIEQYDSSYYREYNKDYWLLSKNMATNFTNEQLIRYYKKYFDLVSADSLQNSFNIISDGIKLEVTNLYAHIEQVVSNSSDDSYKNMDFSAYEPLFLDNMLLKSGFDTDMSKYKAPEKDLTSNQSALLNLGLTYYILKGKSDKLRLAEWFNNRHSSNLLFANIAKEKFEPFLLNRENYPQDTKEAVNTFTAISSNYYNLEKTGPFIIDIIKEENNSKKALESALVFLNGLKYTSNSELANKLKNQLLQDFVAFDESLPLLSRISAYQQINAISGFADDYKIQNKLLNGFVSEIEAIKDPNERNALYDIFINKEHRISDPDIRRTYQKLWVESAFEACGRQIDDNSEQMHAKIKPFVQKLHGHYIVKQWGKDKKEDNVNMADKIEIAKMLADKFVSQQKLSMMIKPEPASFDEMDKANRNKNHMMIAGFDAVKYVVQQKPSEASELIDFLLSKGQINECAEYSKHIKEALKYDTISNFANVSPETLQVLHREFWGYPLEARAVLINELLHSSSDISGENRWEDIFDKVAPKIFPNADSNFSTIGSEFLHSYIKSRKENERTLYLAAMMVAANENSETTDPEKSIAKGIRLFLENSGPAAVKLGQAMASYTDVPKFIRDEMQELKSNAARPSRWEIYEWLEFYKDKDSDNNLDFGKDIWLGKILGSASYFVTLEKGKFENGKIPFQTDKVTKILRAGAKIASDKEFDIFKKMLYDLAQKGVMKNGVDSFVRLVKQAQETVEIETDLNIGYSQLETAKKLYKEKEIYVDGHTFKLHVADWPDFGKNWADLERAKGVDLEQIKDPQYRKAVSKAYFTVELMNMLSGSRFDHDRHSKQLKIDTQTNVIGLFDTGAMAIVDPKEKDKELLGKVIYKTLQKTLDYSSDNGDKAFSRVGAILSSEIEKVYADKQTDSAYLTECQRGLLALTDFYKDLSASDFTDCINSAINNQDMPIDKSIIRGFVKEGIKDVGIFESNQPLLSHKDKETLGALIFNVYASASVEGTQNLGEVIAKEVQKLQQQGINMPILNVVCEKLNDKSATTLGFSIPKELIPTISEVVEQKNIDIAILKGVMKEAVKSVDLQGQKDNYSEKTVKNWANLCMILLI
ncbi:MAG: M48 family metalloprotease [Alphaproteobacteria bacterium]|nr:M48 family metalloprotease [Alphaproteobacteria bacterium]